MNQITVIHIMVAAQAIMLVRAIPQKRLGESQAGSLFKLGRRGCQGISLWEKGSKVFQFGGGDNLPMPVTPHFFLNSP